MYYRSLMEFKLCDLGEWLFGNTKGQCSVFRTCSDTVWSEMLSLFIWS